MGTKILLVIMALLLCAAPAWAQQGIPEAAKKHLLAGIDAIEKAKTPSDFDRAVGEFEAAAKIAPDSPEVYYFLGKTLSMTRGRTKQAVDAYNRYLVLAPNAPDAAKVKAEIAELEKMRAWSRKSGSIGMVAVALPDGFYLRSVHPTSPAAAAGLKENDKIVAVDGKPTKGLTLLQFSELLDGAPGSTCTMDVVRGAQPMKVNFKRTEPFGDKGLFQGNRRKRSRRRGGPVEDSRGGRPLHGLQHGLHDPEPGVHAAAGVLPGKSEVRQHQRG